MGSEAVLLVLLFGKSKYKSDASSVAGIVFLLHVSAKFLPKNIQRLNWKTSSFGLCNLQIYREFIRFQEVVGYFQHIITL